MNKEFKNKGISTYLISGKADYVIVSLALFFFILSRIITEYEIELLGIAAIFGLIRLIKGMASNSRKSID